MIGGSDAQSVDQIFARSCCDWIARSGCGLDYAGLKRVLIMSTSDRALRLAFILLCLFAILPVTITALAQIVCVEFGAGYRACKKALVPRSAS
jgi:hypothetical protein